ncbi:hypothetical protein MASR1M65_10360 [Saprospiraceae bacterium]|nr:hypothetical protein [Saprospiraceae bacterium]MCC6687634.1 hypothetical protein [Saprospiraceae bacterium]
MNMSTAILGVGSRVNHPAYGVGVVTKLHLVAYDVVFVQHGVKTVGKEYDKWEIIDHIPAEENITYTEAEKSLIRILKSWSDISEVVPLGDRWDGGTMVLNPGEANLAAKEIPIETFFHKIVMLRDRLRVMEQKINAHSKMSDEEKIEMQQYITRIYGSLTTFNVLFKKKEHQFVGEKSK